MEDYENEQELEDYQYYEEPKIIDFAFRDIGPEGRAGGVLDENINLFVGTEIMGGELGKFQQRLAIQNLSPYDNFIILLQQILNFDDLNFSTNDKIVLKKTASLLPFIQYRNPLTYTLGYYVHSSLGYTSELKKKLNNIKHHIDTNPQITEFEIIKYARYWNTLLSK